ncbi:MAG: hypothetical protein OJF55_001908 [Rhodanobacteraceae bacterium]|nr:MAG: hypothetical protein OJF55_001908 [Rhodanobacteraceae bacterium]
MCGRACRLSYRCDVRSGLPALLQMRCAVGPAGPPTDAVVGAAAAATMRNERAHRTNVGPSGPPADAMCGRACRPSCKRCGCCRSGGSRDGAQRTRASHERRAFRPSYRCDVWSGLPALLQTPSCRSGGSRDSVRHMCCVGAAAAATMRNECAHTPSMAKSSMVGPAGPPADAMCGRACRLSYRCDVRSGLPALLQMRCAVGPAGPPADAMCGRACRPSYRCCCRSGGSRDDAQRTRASHERRAFRPSCRCDVRSGLPALLQTLWLL